MTDTTRVTDTATRARELLSCPFCGSPAEEGLDAKWGSFVFCTNEEWCNALQHNFTSEERAIAAWNTRTQPSSNDRVKVLEEALREARLQLEYLDGKFAPTGTTAAVLTKIRAALGENNG